MNVCQEPTADSWDDSQDRPIQTVEQQQHIHSFVKMYSLVSLVSLFVLVVLFSDKVNAVVQSLNQCSDVEQYSKILCVVAHPDDIETLAAGTVSFLIECGKKVSYVITTNGDKGWSKNYNMTSTALAGIREQEEVNAGNVLGVSNITFYRQEDGRLESINSVDLKKNLTMTIRTFQPDLILTFSPEIDYNMYKFGTMHADHQATGFAVMNAVWPAARDYLSFIDLFEAGYMPWNVPEVWLFSFTASTTAQVSPDTSVKVRNITGRDFERKLMSLLQHKSQYTDAAAVRESLVKLGSYVARNYGIAGTAETPVATVAEAFQSIVIY
jgi:LmbE family N-acetylglucosaminyl deacetylase